MQNSTMQLWASCDIITSKLEDRAITHKWTEVYYQTNSPANAVFGFNKKRNRYVSMARLLPHMAKANIENYVFFTPKEDYTDHGKYPRDFHGIVNQLNETHFGFCDKIRIDVKCTEGFVEGMSPRIRYFYSLPPTHISSSLPGFERFREYKKHHR